MKDQTVSQSERALLWSFLEGSRRYFVLGTAAALLMTGFEMLIPQVIRVAVDEHRFGLWGAVVLFAAAAGILRWFSQVQNTLGGETLVKRMQDRLYSHITRLPFSWHTEHSAGDILQRCTSDVNMIKAFCSEQLNNLVRVLLLIVVSFSFMFSMNVPMTLLSLLFLPAIVGYSLFFLTKMSVQFARCDENEAVLSTIAQENLTGVRVVRAFGREAAEEKKFREQNEVYTGAWMKLCLLLSWFWAVGDLASGLQVMAVVLFGAWLCLKGSLTVGSYLAFISYINMLVWPIRTLGRLISELSKSEVSLKRIAAILQAEPENLEGPAEDARADVSPEGAAPLTADEALPQAAGEAAPRAESVTAPAEPPAIAYENVSFSFGDNEVLRDVSFAVRPGETVGILGGTGCGKSTLMHLLLRLYELPEGGGRITVDGRDIRELPLKTLRSTVGIVLQEPFLFSRTLGENLTIAARDPEDRQDLREAVETARLKETVLELPKRYDTMVGERGVTLSGGQKQRAAIARLLLEHRPVMIFDDSLSAVDAETDREIRAGLKRCLGHATVFLISHRVSTLMDADRILVMEDGKIRESGTHRELLAMGGRYAEIYRLQSLPEEEACLGGETAPGTEAGPGDGAGPGKEAGHG